MSGEKEQIMSPEQILEGLGHQLYLDIKPIGSYVPYVRSGNLVFISGQGPSIQGQYTSYLGKVGTPSPWRRPSGRRNRRRST